MIRKARVGDIPALLGIEEQAFESDRLNERSFRHLLTKAHAVTLVSEAQHGRLAGYITVLFNRGTPLARLYSMAVAPGLRSRGMGGRLLQEAERVALRNGNAFMRLEVRLDNAGARCFYERHGYRRFAISDDYYEDGVAAVRMEKMLTAEPVVSRGEIPYYAQSLDFTCGAAALMMAMHALDRSLPLDQATELRLWRESTTVFMCSGHGGCGPYGLALAAYHRGFAVEVHVSETGVLFADGVRNAERRRAMELVQEDFLAQLRETSIRVVHQRIPASLLEARVRGGWIPIVLASTYRLDRYKQPHWVVVTGFDDRFVFVHDPFVDDGQRKSRTDRMHIPIPRAGFGRMARYGRSQLKAAVLIGRTQEENDTAHRHH